MSTIQASDVLPVRSRVSWGAILAGAFIAFAIQMVMVAAGVALGVTVVDRASDKTLAVGAAIWTALTLLFSLFIGGWVASRTTAGENKVEAMMYGVLVWGVCVFFMATFTSKLAAIGIQSASTVAANPNVTGLTEADLKAAGVSDEQIAKAKEKAKNPGDAIRDAASDPKTTAAAWWTFAGLILSIGTAISGALVGSGPELVTASVRVRTVGVVEGSREPAAR